MDNFFGRSGTMNQAMNLANTIQGAKSSSGTGRLGALGNLVQMVMSFFS